MANHPGGLGFIGKSNVFILDIKLALPQGPDIEIRDHLWFDPVVCDRLQDDPGCMGEFLSLGDTICDE